MKKVSLAKLYPARLSEFAQLSKKQVMKAGLAAAYFTISIVRASGFQTTSQPNVSLT